MMMMDDVPVPSPSYDKKTIYMKEREREMKEREERKN